MRQRERGWIAASDITAPLLSGPGSVSGGWYGCIGFDRTGTDGVARLQIADFDISDRAEAHAASHGVHRDQIFEVLDSEWMIIRNRHERAAEYLLLGTDFQGRCLAIPVRATHDPLVWRPMTAWYCKKGESAILRRIRGR